MLCAVSNQGTTVSIHHMILEGSFGWVARCITASKARINHLDGNLLEFRLPETNTMNNNILTEFCMRSRLRYSHLCYDSYLSISYPSTTASCTSISSLIWPGTKNVVNRVHEQVSGHATYNNIHPFLQRNKWSNEYCAHYLSGVIESCTAC